MKKGMQLSTGVRDWSKMVLCHLRFVKTLLLLDLALESLLALLRLGPPGVYLCLDSRHRLHAVQCLLGLAPDGDPLHQLHQPSLSSRLVPSPCLDMVKMLPSFQHDYANTSMFLWGCSRADALPNSPCKPSES